METLQPKGKVAGLTEAARRGGDLASAATAPPALEFGAGLRARLERDGITIAWHPAPPYECMRISPDGRYG